MHSPTTIDALIDRDLREHPDFSSSHGLDLERCRVTPTRITCVTGNDGQQAIDVWLVLREATHSNGGYLVVFDEGRGEFGLAVVGSSLPVLLGWHGSFTETLAGM